MGALGVYLAHAEERRQRALEASKESTLPKVESIPFEPSPLILEACNDG
jgi:hypothetical protein